MLHGNSLMLIVGRLFQYRSNFDRQISSLRHVFIIMINIGAFGLNGHYADKHTEFYENWLCGFSFGGNGGWVLKGFNPPHFLGWKRLHGEAKNKRGLCRFFA